MKQINTLSLLILFGSLSSALLGIGFNFNEEYGKEKMSCKQICLALKTKQLNQLKAAAIEEILSTKGISKKELDTSIKNYKNELNKYPLKRVYHDRTIPQKWLWIITQTLLKEGIDPNNITIKNSSDNRFFASVRLKAPSKKNNYVKPIKLYINVNNILKSGSFKTLFLKENNKALYSKEIEALYLKKSEELFIESNALHEISHIKNNDEYYELFLRKILLDEQIKHDPNSKNLNQKSTLLINRFKQSYERIAVLNASCKSKELAQYMNKYFQAFEFKHTTYPPMKDVRKWSAHFCDCWNLPEEKSS